MDQPRSIVASLRAFWTHGLRIERVGYIVGASLLVSGVIHLAILIVGGGSWQGPLSLRKPMTFGLSFGLTLITIVLGRIVSAPERPRTGDAARRLHGGLRARDRAGHAASVAYRLTSTWTRRLTRRSRACWPAAASSSPSSRLC